MGCAVCGGSETAGGTITRGDAYGDARTGSDAGIVVSLQRVGAHTPHHWCVACRNAASIHIDIDMETFE
jgi:hypothetical protein